MAVALDGSVTGQFNAASGAVALATAIDADEISVQVQIAGSATVSSVTSDKITFQQRTRKNNSTTVATEVWYGGWNSHGTINITVNMSASAHFTVEAVGISGLPTGAVWDVNVNIPKAGTGATTAANTGNASTTSTNDFGICSVAIISNAAQSLTAGIVFGTAATGSFQNHTGTTSSDVYGGASYRVMAAAQSGQASAWTGGNAQAWVIVSDAIHGYTATPNPPPTPPSTVQAMRFAKFPDGVGAATSTLEFPPGQGY